MAKISAHGDSKLREWRHPEYGTRFVLTAKGRVLRNYLKGDGLKHVAQCVSERMVARLEQTMSRMGFVETTK